MPAIFDDHNCALREVAAGLGQHILQSLDHELRSRIAETKQDDAHNLGATTRYDLTEVQIERQNDPTLAAGLVENVTVGESL